MSSRARSVSPSVHLPLKRLALCLDCDECFEIGYASCPACGSETWTSLGRFLEGGASEPLSRIINEAIEKQQERRGPFRDVKASRHLLIISRSRGKLYQHLKRAFSGNSSVEVVLDRRGGDRRQGKEDSQVPERRRSDRRSRPEVEAQLRTAGWSLVLVDVPKPQLRRAAR